MRQEKSLVPHVRERTSEMVAVGKLNIGTDRIIRHVQLCDVCTNTEYHVVQIERIAEWDTERSDQEHSQLWCGEDSYHDSTLPAPQERNSERPLKGQRSCDSPM